MCLLYFQVVYNPTSIAEMKQQGNNDTPKESLELQAKRRFEKRRKNNFGFKKVEILPGNIGLLRFDFFRSDSTALELAHAAMTFLSNTDALIIDLRNNYGGGALMYQLMASYFFNEDSVLLSNLYNGLTNETKQFWTNPELTRFKIPNKKLYILTSSKTFSAAEQFTYDLKHLKRAIIVGESTGGGAHMVTKLILNNEYYIFMPFAGAINPITKTNWEGKGVQPHYSISEKKALKTAYKLAFEDIDPKIPKIYYNKFKKTLKELK